MSSFSEAMHSLATDTLPKGHAMQEGDTATCAVVLDSGEIRFIRTFFFNLNKDIMDRMTIPS